MNSIRPEDSSEDDLSLPPSPRNRRRPGGGRTSGGQNVKKVIKAPSNTNSGMGFDWNSLES